MHPVALTIAGSDSSGGAGIQRDIKTFETIGVYAASCITALTAQNTSEVRNILPVPPSFVKEQIDAVFDDLKVSAVKTGMLYDESIILAVVERLEFHRPNFIVVDPVIVSGTGHPLLSNDAVSVIIEGLLPKATLSTPNKNEASILSGTRVSSIRDAEETVKKLFGILGSPVLIKGGHLHDKRAIDVLFDGEKITHFSAERIDKSVHGAGCSFSSAIAAYLTLGNNLISSIEKAKEFVLKGIKNAEDYGKGLLIW